MSKRPPLSLLKAEQASAKSRLFEQVAAVRGRLAPRALAADAAEAVDHHPNIDIRYRKVTLVLTTHDVSGLTIKDMALAADADRLAA